MCPKQLANLNSILNNSLGAGEVPLLGFPIFQRLLPEGPKHLIRFVRLIRKRHLLEGVCGRGEESVFLLFLIQRSVVLFIVLVLVYFLVLRVPVEVVLEALVVVLLIELVRHHFLFLFGSFRKTLLVLSLGRLSEAADLLLFPLIGLFLRLLRSLRQGSGLLVVHFLVFYWLEFSDSLDEVLLMGVLPNGGNRSVV